MWKQIIRSQYRTIRRLIPDKDDQSNRVFSLLSTIKLFNDARRVGIYVSTKYEVNTGSIISSVNKDFFIPHVHNNGMDMIHHKTGESSKNFLDIIIVPSVAFDRNFNRLGQGGGYYDRYLAKHCMNIPKIGLFFREQELRDSYNFESHDVKLNIIVTSDEVIYDSITKEKDV